MARAMIFLFAGLAMGSCNPEKTTTSFYPIDSLVTRQIQHLTKMKAGLLKEARLNGRSDTLTYIPKDTGAWVSELDIFRKLEIINKAVNKDSYVVNDGLADSGSNLTVKALTSRKRELPIVYLRIYYQGDIRKPRKIEALLNEANPLYQSARQLSMNFQQIDNKTLLTSYTIKGSQKVILGDSVSFYIKGKILVD